MFVVPRWSAFDGTIRIANSGEGVAVLSQYIVRRIEKWQAGRIDGCLANRTMSGFPIVLPPIADTTDERRDVDNPNFTVEQVWCAPLHELKGQSGMQYPANGRLNRTGREPCARSGKADRRRPGSWRRRSGAKTLAWLLKVVDGGFRKGGQRPCNAGSRRIEVAIKSLLAPSI